LGVGCDEVIHTLLDLCTPRHRSRCCNERCTFTQRFPILPTMMNNLKSVQ
jgi:hypothetical protein